MSCSFVRPFVRMFSFSLCMFSFIQIAQGNTLEKDADLAKLLPYISHGNKDSDERGVGFVLRAMSGEEALPRRHLRLALREVITCSLQARNDILRLNSAIDPEYDGTPVEFDLTNASKDVDGSRLVVYTNLSIERRCDEFFSSLPDDGDRIQQLIILYQPNKNPVVTLETKSVCREKGKKIPLVVIHTAICDFNFKKK